MAEKWSKVVLHLSVKQSNKCEIWKWKGALLMAIACLLKYNATYYNGYWNCIKEQKKLLKPQPITIFTIIFKYILR